MPNYPGCWHLLNSVKQRWINAKTAELSHMANLESSEKYSKINNWFTLASSALTALSASLLPLIGQDNMVILVITIVLAIMTSLSKWIEQYLTKTDLIKLHNEAIGSFRAHQHELDAITSTIHQHLFLRINYDHEETYDRSFEVSDKIEKARRKFTNLETKAHQKEAKALFKETQIQEILNDISTTLQLIGHVSKKHLEIGASLNMRVKLVR
jgi:hypothetical protein